jgi:serine/threonine protein kinase
LDLSASNLGIDGLDDVEQIGSGGSSRVFRARQIELDRVVAIKVLNGGHDPDAARRFDRERKAMGRLSQHEGIVPVYSTGETNRGEPYLVMPYYPNGSLQDQIDAGAMEWETAVRYVDVAAETIAEAHDSGVVHLDLKPANILLTNTGAPRIADFGIARLMGSPATTAGSTNGAAFTPAYSAPETFLEGTSGPPSDVYGLGATLWALLVGHPPFLTPGDDTNLMAVIGRVVNNPVGDLREFTPPAVCEVIERAMAKEPADRFQTARDFSSALKQAASVSSPDFPPVTVDQAGSTRLFPDPAVPAALSGGASLAVPPALAGNPSALGAPSEPGMADSGLVDDWSDGVTLGMAGPEATTTAFGVAPEPLPSTAETARPLLDETPHGPLSGPVGRNLGGGGPLIEFDRLRAGPLAVGLIGLLLVGAVAFWAFGRSGDDGGAAVASGANSNPAGPAVQQSTDGSNGTDDSSSVSELDQESSTTAESDADAVGTDTTESPTTTEAQATAEESTTTEETTTTTEAPTTTEEPTTTEAPTTTEEPTTTEAPTTTEETTTTLAPRPARLVAANRSGDRAVTVTWLAPVGTPRPDSYRIERTGAFFPRSVADDGLSESFEFIDPSVDPGTHTYRVVAVYDGVDSASIPATVGVGTPTISGGATPDTDRITVSFSSNQCLSLIWVQIVLSPSGAATGAEQLLTGPDLQGCVDSYSETFEGLLPGTAYQVNVRVDGAWVGDPPAQEAYTVLTPIAA